jgi:N-formylglutamate amidohydrolase
MIESSLNNQYPVIISLPHSGTKYSKNFLNSTQLTKNELQLSEDSYVDILLLNILKNNISFVKTNFPRSYVDVNRHPFEVDPLMISSKIPNFINSKTSKTVSGIGVIPRVSIYGNEIYNQLLTRKEVIRRLLQCYFPYHKKLKFLIKSLKNKYNNILVLDFHSMPSSSLVHKTDIVIGNNYNLSCTPTITGLIKNYFKSYDYITLENNPYSGGYITKSLGNPLKGVNVIQIEINRSLYMNEKSLYKYENNMNILAKNINVILTKLVKDINNFN